MADADPLATFIKDYTDPADHEDLESSYEDTLAVECQPVPGRVEGLGQEGRRPLPGHPVTQPGSTAAQTTDRRGGL